MLMDRNWTLPSGIHRTDMQFIVKYNLKSIYRCAFVMQKFPIDSSTLPDPPAQWRKLWQIVELEDGASNQQWGVTLN
jgi:hypothetical protein